MKLILLFFLIALELSTVNTSNQINTKKLSKKFNVVNRKISVNSERPLMLVGFWDLKSMEKRNMEVGHILFIMTFIS